jgi:hypothetical protein
MRRVSQGSASMERTENTGMSPVSSQPCPARVTRLRGSRHGRRRVEFVLPTINARTRGENHHTCLKCFFSLRHFHRVPPIKSGFRKGLTLCEVQLQIPLGCSLISIFNEPSGFASIRVLTIVRRRNIDTPPGPCPSVVTACSL